jgi:hypothetical protein
MHGRARTAGNAAAGSPTNMQELNLDIYSLVTDGVEPGSQEDPDVAAWKSGDQTLFCVVYNSNGSLRGSARDVRR